MRILICGARGFIGRHLGALLLRTGERVPTAVEKHMDHDGQTQRWQRDIRFADGQHVIFKSHWRYGSGNRLVEFVNPFLGLCMAVSVCDGKPHYCGRHFVLKLSPLQLTLPENLLIGHTTIVEEALDDERFDMDFRVAHWLLGETYRYGGEFRA